VFIHINGMLNSRLQILDLITDCIHVLLNFHGIRQPLQILDDLGLGNKDIRFELRLDGSQRIVFEAGNGKVKSSTISHIIS